MRKSGSLRVSTVKGWLLTVASASLIDFVL